MRTPSKYGKIFKKSSIETPFTKKLREALAQRERHIIHEQELRPSAVILPLFQKDTQFNLLFTRRTDEVSHHKGEISFPGGAVEPSDKDLRATAIRECFEEIGLKEKDCHIIGTLDDERTLSDFRVTPFVATSPYPYPFVVNTSEIAELIEVPLEALTDEAIIHKETRFHKGNPYPIYFYRFEDHIIWGATARILKQLLDILKEANISF